MADLAEELVRLHGTLSAAGPGAPSDSDEARVAAALVAGAASKVAYVMADLLELPVVQAQPSLARRLAASCAVGLDVGIPQVVGLHQCEYSHVLGVLPLSLVASRQRAGLHPSASLPGVRKRHAQHVPTRPPAPGRLC